MVRGKALKEFLSLNLGDMADPQLKLSILKMKNVVFHTKHNTVLKISQQPLEIDDNVLVGQMVGELLTDVQTQMSTANVPAVMAAKTNNGA